MRIESLRGPAYAAQPFAEMRRAFAYNRYWLYITILSQVFMHFNQKQQEVHSGSLAVHSWNEPLNEQITRELKK